VDILLGFGPHGADMHVDAGDLVGDDTLLTAVIVSLFTDRQADPGDELPAREADRRGWWADATMPALKTGGSDKIGSRLWLLAREKQLPEVGARYQQYAEEALAWLAAEGHVRAVSVAASNPARGLIYIDVRLTLRDGTDAAWRLKYDLTTETYSLEAA